MSDIARFTVTELAFGRQPFRSRRRNDKVVMAMVLVPEREDAGNYYGSVDGDPKAVTNLPKKLVGNELGGKRFALVTMPGWLVKERKLCQSRQPGLSKALKWTDADLEEWRALRALLYTARGELAMKQAAGCRKRSPRDGIGTRYVSSGW